MNEKLLDRYIEHFGENFPIFAMPLELLEDDSKLEKFIEECIKENKEALEVYDYEEENLY